MQQMPVPMLLQLIQNAKDEEIVNRTAETRDNKAFLEMVGYVQNKLKPNK